MITRCSGIGTADGCARKERKTQRDLERILDESLDGAVWHGNANCLTHFCEQVCDASAR